MRVHELAKELEKESEEVLSVLGEAGIEATTPASGISDDEAEQVRLYYASVPVATEGATGNGEASEAAAGGGGNGKKPKKKKPAKKKPKSDDYAVLVGKGKIFCGSVVAMKGDAVTKEQFDSLPERVQAYFEKQ